MSLPNRSSGSTFNALSKINDQLLPPANTELNWDNPSLAQGVCDVAALGLVSPRFWIRFILSSTTGGLVYLNSWAVWSNATSTLPVLTRLSTGWFTVTLPTAVSDEYDASFNITNNIPVSLSGAIGNFEGSFGFMSCRASAANVITILTANTSGSAADFSGSTVFVVGF